MAFSDRLLQARYRRGFIKAELEKIARLSVRSVSAFENGKRIPSAKTQWILSAALGFPESFFIHGKAAILPEETISFRTLSSISVVPKRAAISAFGFAVEISKWIEDKFHFQRFNYLTFQDIAQKRPPRNFARCGDSASVRLTI